MWTRRDQLLPWVASVGGAAGALLMLAPWAGSGSVDRSLFDLLGSASAIDSLDGAREVFVVIALIIVSATVGVGLIAHLWGSHRVLAVSVIAPGPILVASALVVSSTPLAVRWGAVAGPLAAALGSIAGVIMLISSRHDGSR